MYNNAGLVLPQTGAIGLGIFGISNQNSIAIGICLIITGIVVFKALRFKVKDLRK